MERIHKSHVVGDQARNRPRCFMKRDFPFGNIIHAKIKSNTHYDITRIRACHSECEITFCCCGTRGDRESVLFLVEFDRLGCGGGIEYP
jgi:hypothetical protein